MFNYKTESMLSPLSKGYGSWTAGLVDPYYGEKQHTDRLPGIQSELQRNHTFTVGPRSGRSTAVSVSPRPKTSYTRELTNDALHIPKTYTTRKGALQIFVGPDYPESEESEQEGAPLQPKYVAVRRLAGQELIDLSLKLGTIDRFTKSVLQFGDQDYDKEKASISDATNKAFLKFLHNIEGEEPGDVHSSVQPGGDLQSYLQDLRTSSSLRHYGDGSTYIPKSREAQELQAILRGLDSPCTPQTDGLGDRQGLGQFTRPVSCVSSSGQSPVPPPTPKSAHQVLSSKKLAASLKSVNYLGRQSSSVALDDDDYIGDEYVGATDLHDFEGMQPVTHASVTHKGWSPVDSTDPELLDARRSMYNREDEYESDDSNVVKRRRFREKSCLTEGVLYQGRTAHRVKGQGDVKVTGKGEGQVDGEGQMVMDFIAEEKGESRYVSDNVSIVVDDDVESGVTWADKVDTAEKTLLNSNHVDTTGRENFVHGHKRLLPRRGSGSSDGSGGSLYSQRTPSIITIQKYTAPLVPGNTQEMYRTVYNKRMVSTPKYKHRPLQLGSQTPQPDNQTQGTAGEVPLPQPHEDSTFYDAFIPQIQQNIDERPSSWPVYQYEQDNRLGGEYLLTADVRDKIDGGEQGEVRPSDEGEAEVINVSRASSSSSDSSYFRLQSKLQGDSDTIVEMRVTPPDHSVQIDREDEHIDEVELNQWETENNLEVITENIDGEQSVFEDHYEEADNYADNVDTTLEERQVDIDEIADQTGDEEADQVKGEDITVDVVGAVSQETSGLKVAEEFTDEELSEVVSQNSVPQYINQMEEDDSELEYLVEDEAALPRAPLITEQYAETIIAPDLDSITKELDALGLPKPSSAKKPQKARGSMYVPPPPGKRPPKPKEELVIPEHMKETLESRPSISYEALEEDLERRGFLKDGQVTNIVDETLSGPTLEAVGEGLSEAELELAKKLLQNKINQAKEKIQPLERSRSTVSTPPKKKPTPTKGPAPKSASKGQRKGKVKKSDEDVRTDEEKQMDEIREKQRQDEEKRSKESRELHKKISERRMILKAQEQAVSAKSKEMREEMERLEREADEIQLAEDDARTALADVRRKQRGEREVRRRAELERKKQEVLQRREREKKELDEQRKKELALVEKIADADMRRRLREEEERKMYEEERIAQERVEAELRAAQEAEEEEEERIKELERQAEEEAMQRLIDERETAERQRRRLQEEKEAMEEVERRKTEYLMAEARKLQEEKDRQLRAEMAIREAEKQRLDEFRRLEAEARARMQEELQRRRSDALARREFNLENKDNVAKLGHGHGITRSWTFSYFIRWPRDSYSKSMGLADPVKWKWNRKSKRQKPAPNRQRPTTSI